jgi:hypothetical protein
VLLCFNPSKAHCIKKEKREQKSEYIQHALANTNKETTMKAMAAYHLVLHSPEYVCGLIGLYHPFRLRACRLPPATALISLDSLNASR